MSSKHFEIRSYEPKYVKSVAKLFAETFVERETISNFIKKPVQEAEALFCLPIAEQCATEQLSFVCLDRSLPPEEEIVGFRLSETFNMEHTIVICSPDEETAFIRHFVANTKKDWIDRHPEYQSEEKIRKVIYLIAVGVKSSHENLGIASKLIAVALNNAKAKGFEIAFVFTTGEKTQAMFPLKFGFKEVNSQIYEEFEFNGTKPFTGLTKPRKMIVFEKYLNDWETIIVPEFKG